MAFDASLLLFCVLYSLYSDHPIDFDYEEKKEFQRFVFVMEDDDDDFDESVYKAPCVCVWSNKTPRAKVGDFNRFFCHLLCERSLRGREFI